MFLQSKKNMRFLFMLNKNIKIYNFNGYKLLFARLQKDIKTTAVTKKKFWKRRTLVCDVIILDFGISLKE